MLKCAYCRKPARKIRCHCKGECRGHGIALTCRRHKNKPVFVRFSRAPVAITDRDIP
jgi:hypothetical protein